MRRNAIVKAIKILAVLTFLVFAYAIIRASLSLGDTRMVDFAGLFQTIFCYLIAAILAIFVGIYFSAYSGFRGIKVLSVLITILYLYFIISLPFTVGDTIAWTPLYLCFALLIFSPGFILAVWTSIYFGRMDKDHNTGHQLKNQ